MSSSLIDFDRFVQLANMFYRTIGIRPYNKAVVGGDQSSSLLSDLIFYALLSNLNYHLVLLFVYLGRLTTDRGETFVEISMTMAYVCFVLTGEFKMVFVWWKKKALSALLRELIAIYPSTSEQQESYQLADYLRRNQRFTIVFAVLYQLLIWTYNLFALLQYLIYERWLQVRTIGQILSYSMYVPWQYLGNWSYYLVYGMQSLAGYTSAAGQIACDLLLCSIAMQVTMHYDHMARRIEEYARQQATFARNHRKDMAFLREIVAYHAQILSFSEKMNEIFGVPLFFNFMISSCGICFVGFQMTIGVSIDVIIKLFLYLFCTATQVYLICHYAQLLIDASMNIAQSVFAHNWSGTDVHYQKALVLIGLRAQRPVMLKATKFVSISRGTMTDIMQLSYKFFALLRTMYAQ